jgi:coiled-coil domain-containing protein 55
MSKPSKPGLSFGLSLKKGPSKPAPAKRKPATFGGDDDDDDATPSAFTAPKGKNGKNKDQVAPTVQEVAITELDALCTTAVPAQPPSPTRKPKSKLANAPPPPPTRLSSATTGPEPPLTQFGDLSSALSSRKHAEAAANLDPTIYSYDEVYDSLKAATQKKKEAAKAKEEEDKNRPRYMSSVLSAAAVRERDRLVAEEKRLAREREAEGEEFKDKEKFVTEAYRKQQEEMRRLEEEEKVREEEERRKNKGKGMTGWYKDMLERGERDHEEVLKAVEETVRKKKEGGADDEGGEDGNGEGEEKTEEEVAKELLQKGKKITINEDGQIVDKRELLQGGLNVGAKKKAEALREKSRLAAGQGSQQQSKGGVYVGGKQAMRERQTRMLEAQLEESLKRAREEEEEEKKKVELVAKSRKTEADISSAKERYLARKRAAEEAKKNGTADAP